MHAEEGLLGQFVSIELGNQTPIDLVTYSDETHWEIEHSSDCEAQDIAMLGTASLGQSGFFRPFSR
jgi:hypothetical protein